MKRYLKSAVFLFTLFITIILSSCSRPTQLPTDARRALEAYWQSLPSDPNLTYQIIQAWPGNVPDKTKTPEAPTTDIWCVETEITAATDVSIICAPITWIIIWNDKKVDWDVAMLAMMSSTWPYEACGEEPYNE